MEISDLRVFEAVARLCNMNRAAEELHTVQSNVTARIRHLEEELQARLFERHSRGVALTSTGERLLPFALKAMQLVSDARKAVLDEQGVKGPLVIGTLETTMATRLSPSLAAFAAGHPEIDLTFRTGTTQELVDMVLKHQVEGAFVCGPLRHPDLAEMTLYREELAIISSTRFGKLEDLLATPGIRQLVLRVGCSYRQRLDEIFARRGIVASKPLEFATLEAIFASAAAGVGITLMPRSLVEVFRDRHSVHVHRLPRQESEVITLYLRRRDAYLSKAHSAFLEHLTAPDGLPLVAE